MNKEIILIKELTRIKDVGQPFVQCTIDEFLPSLTPCLGSDPRNETYEIQNCRVRTFAQMRNNVETLIRFAFSPEVEREFEIIFQVIDGQNQDIRNLSTENGLLKYEIEELRIDRSSLDFRLYLVDNMSIWQRVKFVFTGRAEE